MLRRRPAIRLDLIGFRCFRTDTVQSQENETLKKLTIGVFALQGDVSEHISAMERAMSGLGYTGEVIPVRNKVNLMKVDGAILPGGESTTISRLLKNFNLFSLLKDRCIEEKIPIFGTCAGMVLLAKKGDEQVKKTKTELLGLMDARVERNAFGRQKESFESPIEIEGLKTPYPAVFIRAPSYIDTWGDVEVLSRIENKIVLARQRNVLASAFHPELTMDVRLHQLFLAMF